MAEFDVSLESSKRQADGFEGCSRQLKSCADQLRDISSSLRSLGESTSSIKAALRTASSKVDDEQRCAKEMGEKLLSIMSQYDATEKKICGYKQPLKNMQLTQTQAAGSGVLAGTADGEAEDERSAWDKIQDTVNGWKNSAWDKIQDTVNGWIEWYTEDLTNSGLIGLISAFAGPLPLLGIAMLPEEERNLAWVALKQVVYGDFVEESNWLGTGLRAFAEKNPAIRLAVAPRDGAAYLWHSLPEEKRDYITDALKQTLHGDLVEESNKLGAVLSVAVGMVPLIGQVADARDLAADLWHSWTEPSKENWLSLAAATVGTMSSFGDLFKHGDEFGDVAGGILKDFGFDSADEIADGVKSVLKSGNDVVSAVGKGISGFMDAHENLQKVLTKVSGFTAEGSVSKVLEWGGNLVSKIGCEDINKILNKIDWDDAAEGVVDIIKDWTGWDDSKEKYIEQPAFDFITDCIYNLRWGPQAAPAT